MKRYVRRKISVIPTNRKLVVLIGFIAFYMALSFTSISKNPASSSEPKSASTLTQCDCTPDSQPNP